ncbi:hypothetical protein GCM10027047_15350 [Rhodococcus aerolatus]
MTTARLGAAAAVVAALAWSVFLLDVVTGPPGFTTYGFVSELESSSSPGAGLFRTGDLVAGLALLVLAAVLARGRTGLRREVVAAGLVGLTGVSALLDAAHGMSCAGAAPGRCAADVDTVGAMLGALVDVHTASAVLAFLGTGLGPVLLGSAVGRAGRPGWGWASITCGVVVAGCGLLDVAALLAGADVGVLERVRTVVTSVWLLGVAALLLLDRAPVHEVRATAGRGGVRT